MVITLVANLYGKPTLGSAPVSYDAIAGQTGIPGTSTLCFI